MNIMHRFILPIVLAVSVLGTAPRARAAESNPAPAAQSPSPSTSSPAAAPGSPSPSQPAMTPSQPAPTPGTPATSAQAVKTQTATYGAGCFWGVEEVFRTTKGVVSTRVGYAGGKTQTPTYKQVCTDDTGHAEVVEIKFDPTVVTYEQLTALFFKLHDPTQLNRQGPDVGSQYRSVVFFHSPEQKAAAEAIKKKLSDSGKYKRPIVTVIEQAPTFWPAEDYHQQYFFKRGIPNTCHIPEE